MNDLIGWCDNWSWYDFAIRGGIYLASVYVIANIISLGFAFYDMWKANRDDESY